MGDEILVLAKCWNRWKCTFASGVWPERCNARARANSADACSGFTCSACSKIAMALSNCFISW